MCRCAERRAALVRAVSAVAHGEVATARRDLRFVGKSFGEDARAYAKSAAAMAQKNAHLAAARLRLSSR